MLLSKMERIVLELLCASGTPLSVTELVERSPFRFAPSVMVRLALESLLQKGIVEQAGMHASFSGGKRSSYVLYAPASESTGKKKMQP